MFPSLHSVSGGLAASPSMRLSMWSMLAAEASHHRIPIVAITITDGTPRGIMGPCDPPLLAVGVFPSRRSTDQAYKWLTHATSSMDRWTTAQHSMSRGLGGLHLILLACGAASSAPE